MNPLVSELNVLVRKIGEPPLRHHGLILILEVADHCLTGQGKPTQVLGLLNRQIKAPKGYLIAILVVKALAFQSIVEHKVLRSEEPAV